MDKNSGMAKMDKTVKWSQIDKKTVEWLEMVKNSRMATNGQKQWNGQIWTKKQNSQEWTKTSEWPNMDKKVERPEMDKNSRMAKNGQNIRIGNSQHRYMFQYEWGGGKGNRIYLICVANVTKLWFCPIQIVLMHLMQSGDRDNVKLLDSGNQRQGGGKECNHNLKKNNFVFTLQYAS